MARSKKNRARTIATQSGGTEAGNRRLAEPRTAGYVRPWVGNGLTVAAGVALQFTIILLPLVGPTGARTAHARLNAVSWLAVLAVALGLSLWALWTKWQRRRFDGSPFPKWSAGLVLVSCWLLVAFVFGWLRG